MTALSARRNSCLSIVTLGQIRSGQQIKWGMTLGKPGASDFCHPELIRIKARSDEGIVRLALGASQRSGAFDG